MPLHAVEITPTRPATPGELRRAAQAMALAPDADRTRLMPVARGRTARKALRGTRARLEHLLPIDILTTHYPDSTGGVLVNVALPERVHAYLEDTARREGCSTEAQLTAAVHRALAHAERDKARRLDAALDELLTWSTPHQLLAAAARTVNQPTTRHGAAGC
ncbi:hypothetical protein HW130_34685 [Streptomyces sp. PKU-EA00015]|uniref:hypothetical protein n=1 Tax=Streptomyces sp. PKU-EA00015 TaxID=2748326 RepID=UPI0015A15BE4|nr:hypothetical protein [Streptomyces sp. PKU-EA00015]NWF31305.1 hypothetical protein [Streptomyces sp. PKU-EA00015]